MHRSFIEYGIEDSLSLALFSRFCIHVVTIIFSVCTLVFLLSFSVFLSLGVGGGGGCCCCCLLLLGLVKACLFGLVAHSQHNSFFLFLSLFRSLVLSFLYTRYYIYVGTYMNFYILYNILYMRREIHTRITSHHIT